MAEGFGGVSTTQCKKYNAMDSRFHSDQAFWAHWVLSLGVDVH